MKTFLDGRITLMPGDCREVLATLPEASVDAIVCDPPYGLSDPGAQQSIPHRILKALVDVGFPQLYDSDAEFAASSNLARVSVRGAALGRKGGASRKRARVRVPESSVDLDDRIGAETKVCEADESPIVGVTNGNLALELDAESGEFLGDFVLDLGDLPTSAPGDLRGRFVAEAFAGGFAVAISAAGAASSPTLDERSLPVHFCDHDVWPLYDPPSDAVTSPAVVTLPRAINALMLRFDVRGNPLELCATHRAFMGLSPSQFSGPKLVRALSGAGCLASVAEPHRVRFICSGADGAIARYWFHLWCPSRMKVSSLIPSGGFMGKGWDATLPDPEVWVECLRVLKPGGHLVAFSGTRTYHRLAVAIEDAGFEIRDQLAWCYGSGFPKSTDVSKQLDKQEKNKWLNIVNAIDNMDADAILSAWSERYETVSDADASSPRSATATGMNTPKSGSVRAPVVLRANPEGSDATALIAELVSSGAHHIHAENSRSAPSRADASTMASSDRASSAGRRRASHAQTPSTADSFVVCDAWGSLDGGTSHTAKAVEALKIWLGSPPSLRREATDALYAELIDALKLTTLSQSEIFRSFDTTRQMACASAMTATITKSTAASLISFTAGILRREAIDKAAGAEREVVGTVGARMPQAQAKGWGNQGVDAFRDARKGTVEMDITAPATDAALQWQGWGTALKPSWESICLAQKPYDLRAICATVAHNIMRATCQLASHAKDAAGSSASSRNGSAGAFGSAQWSAVAACNTPDDLSALMATLPSRSEIPSSLSIALSWLSILGAISDSASMFTTETASSLTTDLRTLNSLLSKSTASTTVDPAILLGGTGSSASLAAHIFSVVEGRLRLTRELSAHGLATSKDAFSDIRPSWSPICLARKPLSEKTVAANVLTHGTGALNIDGCRVGTESTVRPMGGKATDRTAYGVFAHDKAEHMVGGSESGRWPANLLLDGSDEVLAHFPDAPGQQGDVKGTEPSRTGDENTVAYGKFNGRVPAKARRDGEASANSRYTDAGATNFAALPGMRRGDGASAARFFYQAKADSADRLGSKHPTVKPIDLMQWLCRLVCPKGGTVLDPFAGTGTTGEAAWREGMRAILIEREPEYQADIARRMELAVQPTKRAAVAKSKNKLDKAEDLPLFGGAE